MMVKLIINKNIPKNEYSKYKSMSYLVTSNIGDEYNCRTVNPPFFKTIIIMDEDINNYDLKRIYNMCLINEKIYFIEKYSSFFNSMTKIKKAKHPDYYYCVKPNNKIYNFPNKRSVDFIIAGVQRAGTTSLALNLSKHNDIYINSEHDPKKSEIHYYDLKWKLGLDWYKKQFDYSKKLVGDKTPDLMSIDYTFPMIQQVNPYVKLIISLRDPIMRAYSSWKMTSLYWGEHRTFEECIETDKKIKNRTFHTIMSEYLQRGLYYRQIKLLKKWFPSQNILILLSEDMKNHSIREYEKIYNFLNLTTNNINYEKIHISEDKTTVSDELYNRLIPYYKEDVEKLENLLKIKTGWLQTRNI